MKTPIFQAGSSTKTSLEKVSNDDMVYDVVIVGSGIAGSIIASQLGKDRRVLILEAGLGGDRTLSSYQEYLTHYFATAYKDNNSPYPVNPNAPMPRGSDAHKIPAGVTDGTGYLVQTGPFTTDTSYTRVTGGTTMHWEAKTPRFMPSDFKMRTEFAQGPDWPIEYKDLEPFYERAEKEIGVSADVVVQQSIGIPYREHYVYPMQGFPLSYLDEMVANGIEDTTIELDGQKYELGVRPFPQGRNGIPNPNYNNGEGFSPTGAVNSTQVEFGGRCQGNNNCVPICPVQAKYNAGKTLAVALQKSNVELLAQSVVSKVCTDGNGRVTHLEFKAYRSPSSPEYKIGKVRAKVFVLATNAIENARLLLASDLPRANPLIGRNLMDHAYLLNWALMPEDCGTMRGTNCTGGIVSLRNGSFRKRQAAFAVDIHNDGWGWAMGSPLYDLRLLVDEQNKFGRGLRNGLASRINRQLQLAFMIEVLPDPCNRVTVDPQYTDPLGNMRPKIAYAVPPYTMRGVAYARQFAQMIFQRLGAEDYTAYDPTDFGYVVHEGEGFVIRGGNHLAGTHIMGTDKSNSVVNVDQRSWEYENLYIVGGGSLPSIGTANITLTLSALCFRTADVISARLAAPQAISIGTPGGEPVHA